MLAVLSACSTPAEVRGGVFEPEPFTSVPEIIEQDGPWAGLNARIRIVYGDYDDETLCLATNIYHEARGSTRADQRATVNVVKNRAKESSKTYCEVIWQRHQFSWTSDGRGDYPRDQTAFLKALELAGNSSAIKDNTGGANHYHLASIEPAWAIGVEPKKQIGAHVYMRI